MISARVLQIVLVVELASAALSRNCRANDSSADISTLYASSQQDLSHLDGCTNLTGNIVLLPDYSGPFKLNGVTDLNGGIAMNASEYSENVESFEMPDVVNYAGLLELYQVSDVRLPKVERMQELSLRSYKGGKADLGRLVESELIGVAGVWETNLTSLQRVGTSGVIFSSYVITPWKDQEYGAIEVDLPALESTAGLNILGRIAKLSLPRLANITRDPSAFDGQPFNSTISIETSNLDVQLPALTTLDYPLAVEGLVSTLNLSSLVQADQDIFVETGTSSDISFPVLERAQGIHLARSISSVNAPFLRSATVLDISTYSLNPCTGSVDDIYIAPYDASKSNVHCPATTTSGSDYTPKPKSSYHAPLQPGTIAGIALGCIAGVTGLAVVVICCRKKKAGKRAVSSREGTVHVYDDAPPPYSRSPL